MVPFALFMLLAILAGIWFWGPREPVELGPVPIDLPDDLDAWLAVREQGIDPQRAGRIVWATEPGQKTPLALIYLHGFSASPQEIRPVPDMVARELGANLYFARLAGHGSDGAALGQVRVSDWWRDTAEAIAVGRRLGQRIVLIGNSTGGTLAAEAARDPVLGPQIDAVVMISPNFGILRRGAGLLTWPFARHWVPLIAGRERCFAPRNTAHEQGWTPCYPMVATLPLAALAEHGAGGDYTQAHQPALFIWSDADQIVDAEKTRIVARKWGGAATRQPVTPGPGDDHNNHVLAGDVLSPGGTAPMARLITDWIRATLP